MQFFQYRKSPTRTLLTSTAGTLNGFVASVTAANATIGAIYKDNNGSGSNTCVVLQTISSGSLIFCSSTNNAGTIVSPLAKQSGTGDATIAVSNAKSLANYSPPSGCNLLRVRGVGCGGGGAGSGTGTSGGTGVTGNNSYFISPAGILLTGNGGSGGTSGGTSGSGGTASISGGSNGFAIQGAAGAVQALYSSASYYGASGSGGNSPFGGAGMAVVNQIGLSAASNSGSGGSGGGGNVSATVPGGGGGSGGYFEYIFKSSDIVTTNGSVFWFKSDAAGGTGGSAGTSGYGGGAGAGGFIDILEEY